MTAGMPWSVRGIDPEIRGDALHAAHASGMTLGQWLNGVIRDQIVDIRAAGGRTEPATAPQPQTQGRQDMAGPSMTHYHAQPQYPYGAGPAFPGAPMMPPPYMMPAQPFPPMAPGYPGYPMPMPAAVDPLEARLRAYHNADTAVGSVPGADKLLKVIDAAVRSSEQKTAAAIEALATLMDKQRKADADAQARQAALQAAHAEQMARAQESQQKQEIAAAQAMQANAVRDIEATRSQLAGAQTAGAAEVTQVLARMAERLEGLEKSFASARNARTEEQLADARRVEDRLGDALDTAVADSAGEGQFGEVDASLHDAEAPAGVSHAVRPPPRVQRRPRITVPRSSYDVAEIAARQRMLESGELAPRGTPESAALDAIRRSIAALADQVRETAQSREAARGVDGDIRSDLKELQRSVRELAPRQIVSSVNESLLALARRIEQSREEGVRESHLQPIEALLNEMRSNMMEMREPRALHAINDSIAALAARVDTINERSADDMQLTGVRNEIADLRAIVADARNSQPFEAIKDQISGLTERLEAVTERPRDSRVLSLLTDAVEDVRKTIRKIDPDAVFARLERRLEGLEGLSGRIDALTRKLHDDGSLRIANVDFGGLTDRIDALAERFDRAPAGPVDLGGITERIEQMTAAFARQGEPDLSPLIRRMDLIQETIEQKSAGPEVKTLENILRRLADRIEDVRQSNAAESTSAIDGLQNQMAQLADRLDRAPKGAEVFGGIEQTLGELCRRVAEIPDSAATAAKSAAMSAVKSAGPAIDPLAAEGMLLIKRDLTELKTAQADAETKSRELLAKLNASLETIATRLATTETDAHPRAAHPVAAAAVAAPMPAPASFAVPRPAAPATPAAPASNGRAAPQLARVTEQAGDRPQPPARRPEAHAAMSAPAAPAQAAHAPMPRSDAQDSDFDLPLEPGAGGAVAGGLAAPSGSDARSAFIAAARRAAQSAADQTGNAMAEIDRDAAASAKAVGGSSGRFGGVANILAARKKPILLGVAALLVLLGGLRVATQMLDGDQSAAEATAGVSQRQAATPPADPAPRIAEASPAPATEQVAVSQAAPARAEPVPAAPQQASAPAPKAQEEAGKSTEALLAMTPAAPEKLKQAALSGNLSALYEIGARLAEGRGGLPRDLKLAAQWLEAAAAKGFAPAQYRLGSFNREGLGVAKDSKVAFTWFQRAAEQGNVLAMHNLAVLYSEGVNGAPDYASAAQWFRNAAEYGVKDSQFNTAILYLRGLGLAQDSVEAYKWFAAAARQGDQDAVKKRDTLFSQLPAEKQPGAREVAEKFVARKPDVRANDVIAPEGGWDGPRLPTLAAPMKKAPKSV